jgi:hypothetical protein
MPSAAAIAAQSTTTMATVTQFICEAPSRSSAGSVNIVDQL